MRAQFQMLGTRGKLFATVVLILLATAVLYAMVAGPGNGGGGGGGRYKGRGRYAAQLSYQQYGQNSNEYKIAIVADRDTASKVVTEQDMSWESEVMTATLVRNPLDGTYSVNWTSHVRLTSKLNENGRAMELSELVHFGGRLLAFDDRTGVVSEIDLENRLAIPRYILMEGDGHTNKGQKTEWATVKDGQLYVGSIGKEWTNSKGQTLHYNPQCVKVIDTEGRISSQNWRPIFELLRKATNTVYPGYLIHEAVCWNPVIARWYFMPRKVSELPYDEEFDEERGSDTVVSLDHTFSDPQVSHIGTLDRKRGFSSCKFIPYRETEFVALKTMEYKGQIASCLSLFLSLLFFSYIR